MSAEAGGASDTVTAEPLTPGELLRRERERRALSLQQAAEDLRLDPWMVEAIEANRFEALGAPVYAKGHLRKYATLLGLSPAVIVERYDALSGTPDVPTPIPATLIAPPLPERRSMKSAAWIGAGILLVGAALWLAVELLGSRSAQVTELASEPIVAPSEGEAELPTQPEPQAAAPAEAPPRTQPETATPAQPSEAPSSGARSDSSRSPAPVGSANAVRLQLEFSETSWAEVYDAAGNRLMFDLGVPGRVRTLVGEPPLRVTLGLAAAVSARVDDRPITIPQRAGRDAAKFVVEADGSVRPERSMSTTASREVTLE